MTPAPGCGFGLVGDGESANDAHLQVGMAGRWCCCNILGIPIMISLAPLDGRMRSGGR